VRKYPLLEMFILMKIIDFWRNPIFSSNENTNFLLEPKSRKPEI